MVNTNFISVATVDAIPRLLRVGWSLDIQLDAIHATWRGNDDTTRRVNGMLAVYDLWARLHS